MTLNELRYIVAVDRVRHFGRAAEDCCVSQPTLSIAIKKLEKELEIKIFERSRQDVQLTEPGKDIVQRARAILEKADELMDQAKKSRDRRAESLRIGLIYTVGPSLLPYLIPALNDIAPQMPVLIEEGYTSDLRVQLKKGELDLIVVATPFSEPGMLTQALYEEEFVVVLPAAHPWNKLDQIYPEQLAEEPVLLLGEGHCFRDQVLDYCPGLRQTLGTRMRQSIVGGSLETIRHMVASGVGITVLPKASAGLERYNASLISVRPFADRPPKREIAIAWRKNYSRHEAVAVVAEAIRRCNMGGINIIGPETASIAKR